MDISPRERVEQLLAEHAVAADTAAAETTDLARRLRGAAKEELATSGAEGGDATGGLRSRARAMIACADQLLQLAECERLVAETATSILHRDRCDTP